jgi:hypothetical protein
MRLASILLSFALFASVACTSARKPNPAADRGDAGQPELGAVIAKICMDSCTGPMARLTAWLEPGGAPALFVYDGDINRCSHPWRIWYDRQGKELAVVGSGPLPEGEQRPSGRAIHQRLTAGLTEGKTTYCR